MINLSQYNDAPVAVFGLGKTGLSASYALINSGVEVWAWDDNSDVRNQAKASNVPLKDLYECQWEQVKILILSPGVPHKFPKPHPIVCLARNSGCAIIGDTELFFESKQSASCIGITGTNGKSTTTSLINHILNSSKISNNVGGNIGSPILSLSSLPDEGFFVVEMSSYQLEITPSLVFKIAILLNISDDHLDRHGGIDGYIRAKKLIFLNQKFSDFALIGVDDVYCMEIYSSLRRRQLQNIIPISCQGAMNGGVYVKDGILFDNIDNQNQEILDLHSVLSLLGPHNWQNAAAAYAAAKIAGADKDSIINGLKTYTGLPHRQELVAVIDGVSYINDSKATNVSSTARALACYDIIYWIAGGKSKGVELDALKPYASQIKKAYLIGESEEDFALALPKSISIIHCGTLKVALNKAHNDILKKNHNSKAVVLFSPACASFDQFKNFEDRGNAFCQMVKELPGKREKIMQRVH